MRQRWLWVLVAFAVFLLIAKYLLLDTAATPGAAFSIDPAALHALAVSSGPLPERLEVEQVGSFEFPKKMVIAGDPFRAHPMVLLAHRVIWPGRSLIIDTAMGPDAAKAIPGSKIDPAAFARVQAAIAKADFVVFTHEHPDHVGGLARAPAFAKLAQKVHMTREQLGGPKLERDAFPAGSLEQLKPLDYTGLYALAPGVVLQHAPGHSVGSQLIYVELRDGTRFLFVGDIAWSAENITRQIGRPGIATLLMKEDRPAVAAQLRALAALPREIHLIVAHDPVTLEKDLKSGLYQRGFSIQ